MESATGFHCPVCGGSIVASIENSSIGPIIYDFQCSDWGAFDGSIALHKLPDKAEAFSALTECLDNLLVVWARDVWEHAHAVSERN